MPHVLVIACALLSAGQVAAAKTYRLADSYDETNFFQSFEFFNETDRTDGFVQYQDAASASAMGLARYQDGQVYLGSDHDTVDPADGRASVRVFSKMKYSNMLLVADVAHMPVGCGTWPALWTYGNPWPSMGEVDIIEGVNSQTHNQITLHTSSNCTMTKGKSIAGTKLSATAHCGAQEGLMGCPQTTQLKKAFGRELNAAGGGVYAMLRDSHAISVYFFPRNSSVGARLANSQPTIDTSTFGTPMASFVGGSTCNIDDIFGEHWITVNIDFCGAWAGANDVWAADAECSAKAATCKEYVAQNPTALQEAYWLFNSIKVYTTSGSESSSSGSTSSTKWTGRPASAAAGPWTGRRRPCVA